MDYDIELANSLGISAGEPGFVCVRVAPDIYASVGSYGGTVTLPVGPVSVMWNATSDRLFLDVEVPVGIHLQVRLPAKNDDSLFVDGEPIATDTQTVRSDSFVELAVLPGSRYLFQVEKAKP